MQDVQDRLLGVKRSIERNIREGKKVSRYYRSLVNRPVIYMIHSNSSVQSHYNHVQRMGYLLDLDESDPTDFIYTSLTAGAPSGNMLGSEQDGSGSQSQRQRQTLTPN